MSSNNVNKTKIIRELVCLADSMLQTLQEFKCESVDYYGRRLNDIADRGNCGSLVMCAQDRVRCTKRKKGEGCDSK